MYDISVNVAYKDISNDDESDEHFRKCFLDVFGLKEFDDGVVVESLDGVYDNLIKFENIKPIFSELQKQLSKRMPMFKAEDKDLMLFLFSYDTFEDAHKLMQNLHKNNHKSIDQEFVDKIISTIKNSM
tara:strand:+ start:491 stop:874 length:384 start_codon:yes stop_codon:yes gene_type:complete